MDNPVAVKISADILVELGKMAHTALNKDKIKICSVIDLSEKTIGDWYNEITLACTSFRTYYNSGKKITDEKVSEFIDFAESRTNSPAIQCSIQILDEIIKELNKGKPRKLMGKVDIELIELFRQELKQFYDLVFGTKAIMLESGIPKLKGNKDDAKRIAKWIKDLDGIRSQIGTNAMKILQELECSKEMIGKISNQNNTNRK